MKKLFLFFLVVPAVLFAQQQQQPQCRPDGIRTFAVETYLRNEEANKPDAQKIRLFFGSMKPFDKRKPTLLLIPGGPGGSFADVENVAGNSPLNQYMNVVSFDHRGLGCTKIKGPVYPYYEKGLFSSTRAAHDLEAMRRTLLGADSKWFVYGVSYGGMLAQNYAIKFPAAVKGLLLDSTMHDHRMVRIAGRKYFRLAVDSVPGMKETYGRLVVKFPALRNEVLRMVMSYEKSYAGRTRYVPELFSRIAAASSAAEAMKIVNEEKKKPKVAIWYDPMIGMARQIICEEIWDYPGNVPEAGYFLVDHKESCEQFRQYRIPMAYGEGLKKLPMRTIIMGGRFDPITPIESMRIMHKLVARSFLMENKYAGHGLFAQLPECFGGLLMALVTEAPDEHIRQVITSQACQGEPKLTEAGRSFRIQKVLTPVPRR
jgi:pimeloyl-ACP methyl ester carboxylesterase